MFKSQIDERIRCLFWKDQHQTTTYFIGKKKRTLVLSLIIDPADYEIWKIERKRTKIGENIREGPLI
jgi:hypothetical protein